ncbi:iron ABC transporter permease [Candidatus Falkowbacteria bacterium]|nr:iron ABC transporter permease [Candidatus Falkowbacteria bacterium]
MSNGQIIKAIGFSFLIGLIVTLLNLIFGVPLAWVIARNKNFFVRTIDNLVDLSLVMPTAALGFSIYLYWGTSFGLGRLFGLDGGLFGRGMIMIILLHTVFTLPYMIRSVTAALAQIGPAYEEAAETMGASPFTFFRTIAMPLFRDGIINGSILSFTRSLSETGATMMVAGSLVTAPVLIINLKNQGNLPGAAGASIMLILSAIIILFLAKTTLGERRASLRHIYSPLEKKISKLAPVKNYVIFTFFIIFIFLPTVQILLYNLMHFRTPGYLLLMQSLMISFGVAFAATFANLIFSVPLSYLIARNRFRLGRILESLNETVLLMPTSALGLSLALFWRNFFSSEIIILILAHLCFTFPLLVKPLVSAFKEISDSQEEAAYSLGAGIKKMSITVLLPQIKPAIIAGIIMAFMRSLSETGATLAVSKNIKTVSILIVDFFQSNRLEEAAFACTILFAVALLFLVLLKNNKVAGFIKPGKADN